MNSDQYNCNKAARDGDFDKLMGYLSRRIFPDMRAMRIVFKQKNTGHTKIIEHLSKKKILYNSIVGKLASSNLKDLSLQEKVNDAAKYGELNTLRHSKCKPSLMGVKDAIDNKHYHVLNFLMQKHPDYFNICLARLAMEF